MQYQAFEVPQSAGSDTAKKVIAIIDFKSFKM